MDISKSGNKPGKLFFINLLLVFFLSVLDTHNISGQTQVAPDRYRVEFTDKSHNNYVLDRPIEFLSERSLLRRVKQKISVNAGDLPVSAYYLDSLKRMGCQVLNTSRWFNSAIIKASPSIIEQLKSISFIKQQASGVRLSNVSNQQGIFKKNQLSAVNDTVSISTEYYGASAEQIGQLNGHTLHNRGYRGQGMFIAVIDAGFYKVNELSSFENLLQKGQLKALKNFTNESGGWGTNNHGSNVFSIIASNLPGRIIGSAPEADYVLLRSEESNSEYIVEEDNWIAAAEYADSVGVDLITSSLGYSTFNDPSQNYTYQQLDGRTARISQAATMASRKGLLVVISAGNDGDLPWKYISVPADADSIITVGAVDKNGQYASFSSIGPTADGRIKPDLVAMGKQTAYQGSSGGITRGNGTSYSTPLLAGLVACLWQACPSKTAQEIIRTLKKSANKYLEPDSLYGYGIPDVGKALQLFMPNVPQNDIVAYPNPFTGAFTILLVPAQHEQVTIRIFNVSGKLIFQTKDYVIGYNTYEKSIDSSRNFASGMYIIDVATHAGRYISKVIKQ